MLPRQFRQNRRRSRGNYTRKNNNKNMRALKKIPMMGVSATHCFDFIGFESIRRTIPSHSSPGNLQNASRIRVVVDSSALVRAVALAIDAVEDFDGDSRDQDVTMD